MGGEILVVPFEGQGHLFPCIELCNHFVARDFTATLIIPSRISSSSVRTNPKIEILEIDIGGQPAPPGGDIMNFFEERNREMGLKIEELLAGRLQKPVCAVIDTMLSSTRAVFWKFGIETVTFFTSGACSPAVDLCAWKAGVKESEIKPGETLVLPGLPDEMSLSFSDFKRKPPPGFERGPPPSGNRPPELGEEPKWMREVKGSIGLMVNTCDELEGQFLGYLSKNLDLPVWGVGPLMPEDYWKQMARDGKLRASRNSNYTEDEVMEWLDCKPVGSVLYVSFGSEVSPTNEEFVQLAKALEESDQPFIWVLNPNVVVHGPPPPRLMILGHPSTGGFLSHCGWNSTVEAIGRGVPILAWPIRGDQFSDAKLVVSLLKTGYMVSDDLSETVEKEQIAMGIELLMVDQEMKKRAQVIAADFGNAFPPSSVAALNAFRNFLNGRQIDHHLPTAASSSVPSNPSFKLMMCSSGSEKDGVVSRRSILVSGSCVISSSAILLGFSGNGFAVIKQGLLAGRVPGLSEPDAQGWRTYRRPDEKSGGHGVGWSPIIPYTFSVPSGWEEVPVSIADLGDLGDEATIEKIGKPERVIAAFGPEVIGENVEGKVLSTDVVEHEGRTYYQFELEPPHIFITATAAGNRLYLFSVTANGLQWKKNYKDLKRIANSFRVV
ncbi:unnamed protein product [Rhodiola kirilowii]